MRVKDLVGILQGLDPESCVTFTLGRDKEYRDMCAKAELIIGECLDYLDVDRIEIYPEEGGKEMMADVVLQQINIVFLDGIDEDFEKMYTKNNKEEKEL